MADIKAIAEQLVNLTVIEVTELKNILKEEYGIEPAAAAVAVAAGPGVELLTEVHNIDPLGTKSRTNRRRRISSSTLNLQL